MSERQLILQIESIINKILYKKNVINQTMYEEISKKLDTLLFEDKQ